eukprot:scaffold1804_cov263-Pinguiococcus_pyrenoidosus.AAC.11
MSPKFSRETVSEAVSGTTSIESTGSMNCKDEYRHLMPGDAMPSKMQQSDDLAGLSPFTNIESVSFDFDFPEDLEKKGHLDDSLQCQPASKGSHVVNLATLQENGPSDPNDCIRVVISGAGKKTSPTGAKIRPASQESITVRTSFSPKSEAYLRAARNAKLRTPPVRSPSAPRSSATKRKKRG